MRGIEREITDLIRKKAVEPNMARVLLKVAEHQSELQHGLIEMAKTIAAITSMLEVHTGLMDQMKHVSERLKAERFGEKIEEIRSTTFGSEGVE